MEWYRHGMYPEWHLSGANFSPRDLKELYPDLILTNSKEKTDKRTLGRFKGKEYGSGSTKVLVDKSISHKLEWLLDFIIANSVKIKKLGIEDEIIWIYWYGVQGNMEMDSTLIKKIAKTELSMAMNYIYIEPDNA